MLEKIKRYIDRFMNDYIWDIFELKSNDPENGSFYICRGYMLSKNKQYTQLVILSENNRGQIKKVKDFNYNIKKVAGKFKEIIIEIKNEVIDTQNMKLMNTYIPEKMSETNDEQIFDKIFDEDKKEE
jgi:thiamine pyrophosphokinase